MNEKKKPADAAWFDLPRHLPKHSEKVYVRGRNNASERLMVFFATPAPRWETPDGNTAYQFERFTQWRRP